VLPKHENHEYTRITIYKKKKRVAARSGVRSNAGSVFNHIPACVRSSDVCSTTVASQCRVHSSVGVAFDHSVFERT
jgi:hypothetical protein